MTFFSGGSHGRHRVPTPCRTWGDGGGQAVSWLTLFNVMCTFSLDSFNSSCIFPCTQASMRSYMPLIEGSRGIWVSGYFAYRELPKVEKTLIICCQASEQPDCTWMLHVFLFNMSPGNSSSVLFFSGTTRIARRRPRTSVLRSSFSILASRASR